MSNDLSKNHGDPDMDECSSVYHKCVMEVSQIPRNESSTERPVRETSVASSSRGRSLRLPQISPVTRDLKLKNQVVVSLQVVSLHWQNRLLQLTFFTDCFYRCLKLC